MSAKSRYSYSGRTAVHIPRRGRLYKEMHEYQPAKELNEDQAYQVSVWFEEDIFGSAITTLHSILSQSICPTAKSRKIIPQAQQLAILATIIVHPDLTTSLRNIRSDTRNPQLAFHYLYDFLRIVRPAEAKLDEAWAFKKTKGQPKRKVRVGRGAVQRAERTTDAGDDDDLESKYASTESLFAQTDDFWEVIGWAFTCSVEHKRRWEWWHLLLKIFLDAFEADWTDNVENSPERALFLQFLPSANSSGLKKAYNAIIANGTDAAVPYREIWPHELDRQKFHSVTESGLTKRGDLMERLLAEELEAELEEAAKRTAEAEAEQKLDSSSASKGKKKATKSHSSTSDVWGGMDALVLRMRFFNLLCSVCYVGQFVPLPDLLQAHLDFVGALPADQFLLFLGGNIDRNPSFHKIMMEFFIEKWLPSSSPVFTQTLVVPQRITKKRSMKALESEDVIVVGRERKKGRGSLPGPAEMSEISPPPRKPKLDKDINTDYGHLTRKKFIFCYAPFAAATEKASENYRMTIIIQIMAQLLLNENDLEFGEDLEDAVQQGINAREAKMQSGMENKRRRQANEAEETECMHRMQIAHKCLLHIVQVAKAKKAKSDDASGSTTPTLSPPLPRETIAIHIA